MGRAGPRRAQKPELFDGHSMVGHRALRNAFAWPLDRGRHEDGLWVVRQADLRSTKHTFGRTALKDDPAIFAVHRKDYGLSDRLPPMKLGLILCLINDCFCDDLKVESCG
jgi:hypothetical protein